MAGTVEKQAFSFTGALKAFMSLANIGSKAAKGGLILSAGAGVGAGAAAGMVAGHLKRNNGELLALKRRKDFYDSKIREIRNVNWLNDLMAAKRKLDTARLTDDERTALEKKYLELMNA